MDVLPLRTARLTIVPATLAHLVAELEMPARLGALLGALVPAGWPPGEYDRAALEFFRERLEAEGPEAVGWYGWYVLLHRETVAGPALSYPVLVSAAGYLGRPDEAGEVEVGYSVLPEYAGQGIATEAVEALAAHALAFPGVRRVRAHTDATNHASRAVLARAGFTEAGVDAVTKQLRYEYSRRANRFGEESRDAANGN